jgi:tetratricopeptide (TPR) repeat protein
MRRLPAPGIDYNQTSRIVNQGTQNSGNIEGDEALQPAATEIPLGLRLALEEGRVVLFLGAGIGRYFKTSAGDSSPNGRELAQELAKHFEISSSDYNLSKIAEVIDLRGHRKDLEAYLRKRLSGLVPDDSVRWLAAVKWRAIYTTNYDDGIERTYALIAAPRQKPITVSETAHVVDIDPRFEVGVYHLHGTLFGDNQPNIIITQSDYSRYAERRRMLFELLRKEFVTATILYIGYANDDPDWRLLLSELTQEYYPNPLPQSYRVAPDSSELDVEILKGRGIETINTRYHEFASMASAVLTNDQGDVDRLAILQATVPAELALAFSANPAPVVRLLSSWTHVNTALFSERPNLEAFLKGDRPNWGLLGARLYFERDIEEDLYESLLDFATSELRRPVVELVLGPAGYGTTTLLMTAAAKLVSDRAGTILFLKPGATVIEGDIEFAASVFSNNIFFIVDNAADFTFSLATAIQKLRNNRQAALFLLGERLNEWRQTSPRITAEEFILEPLSDPEIFRLLDFLSKNGELGELTHLSRDHQFNVIKVRNRQELLVTLREVIEDNTFDAIIESEFRGIQDPTARQAYLTVCCFYQHGTYVRDQLLANSISVEFSELHSRTGPGTDGVILYDLVNESLGIYGARARHRTIAEVVWERCAEPLEREHILQTSFALLNLALRLDKVAFDAFIRADRVLNRIRSLEGKTTFFDTACKKDPNNPYVRQHYARMLVRERKDDLALGQIEEALRLDPSIRVLHHTKGYVLAHLAETIESTEIARRRLVQSEQAFRQCLSMNDRDEYGYEGIARLYLKWAQRASSADEAADYIRKAEEIISEGLRKVRVREALWIVSAEIQEWLGQRPSHIQALQRAVHDTPGSVIARYLLGRAYRRQGNFKDAIQVLDPVIKNYHDEFRSFTEYAFSMFMSGEPLAKCIAVLRLSSLYGYGDPRFLATLAGMLYLNEDFAEASEVFREGIRRELPATGLNTTHFEPSDPKTGNPILLTGRVVQIRTGYTLIEVSGKPTAILCPGSRYNGVVMRKGQILTFRLVFTGKGPIAQDPIIAD